jgi:hypothetical protein
MEVNMEFSTVKTFQFEAPFPSRSGKAHFVVHMVKSDDSPDAKLLIACIHHEGTEAFTREDWREFTKAYCDNQRDDLEAWFQVDAVSTRIFDEVHKFECPEDDFVGGYYYR